jgi:DNA-binding LytR/AlgR family response regulator
MKVLIIEDEKKTALLLREIIESNSERLVVNVLDSIEEAVPYLIKNQMKIDLIFMDIQLADGISFEIFKQVQVQIPVVFCTAYDSYMLKAFKNSGLDYILKPFGDEEIEMAFAKLNQLKDKYANATLKSDLISKTLADNGPKQSTFLVRYRQKMFAMNTSDIAFLFIENNNVFVFNFNSEKYLISKTLEQFMEADSYNDFFRINRKMILNRKAVKEIEPYFMRKVVVHLKVNSPEKAIVSRLKVTPFLKWIEMRH